MSLEEELKTEVFYKHLIEEDDLEDKIGMSEASVFIRDAKKTSGISINETLKYLTSNVEEEFGFPELLVTLSEEDYAREETNIDEKVIGEVFDYIGDNSMFKGLGVNTDAFLVSEEEDDSYLLFPSGNIYKCTLQARPFYSLDDRVVQAGHRRPCIDKNMNPICSEEYNFLGSKALEKIFSYTYSSETSYKKFDQEKTDFVPSITINK